MMVNNPYFGIFKKIMQRMRDLNRYLMNRKFVYSQILLERFFVLLTFL